MQIALMSGAVKNAGDFLITERCKKLLLYKYPNSEIIIYTRNHPILEQDLNIINNMDRIIIGGGPCYCKHLYPQIMPLVPNLDLIKPKIFMLGCGWYGNTTNTDYLYKYRFDESTNIFFKRVKEDSKWFGCRDYYSVKTLYSNGY